MSLPNESNVATEKVLGVNWDPIKDHLCFSAKLNFFSIRKRGIQKDNPNNDAKLTPPLTKRMISSQVNSMYDPLGLAGPFTVLAKILMRHLWAFIIFCDASEDAYGSCAYVQWQRQGGGFACNLIVSKNRLALAKKCPSTK